MKIRVTIDAETYEVEVGDMNARPIHATIEGETFQVWPEEAAAIIPVVEHRASVQAAPVAAQQAAPANGSGSPAANTTKAVTAPIPGVIIAVNVKEGQAVSFGQELCVLEAMKMKNVIRANRAGTIATIRVAIGDQVKRSQVMIEYTD